MTALDLDLQQVGLALDLVAEWQLDVIKASKVWWEWMKWAARDDDPSQLDLTPGSGFWNEIQLLDDLFQSSAMQSHIIGLTYETQMLNNGTCLAAWGQQSHYTVPCPNEIFDNDSYDSVTCRERGLHCVRHDFDSLVPD